MILLDTNIFVRLANKKDPLYGPVLSAISGCQKKGETLFLAGQCLQEFWVVATRSGSHNGLEMSPPRADAFLAQFLRMFPKLPDPPGLFDMWRTLVNQHGISGVKAYDVRIAALMKTSDLSRLMTLNGADFRNFGLDVVDPRDPRSW